MGSVKINLGFQGKAEDIGYRYLDVSNTLTVSSTKSDITMLKDMACIKQSIKNLFMFRKGERILLPEYGNPLLAIVDETVTPETEGKIREELYKAFEKWEPRVQLQDIIITPNEEEHIYYVEIKYNVPSLFDRTESMAFTIS